MDCFAWLSLLLARLGVLFMRRTGRRVSTLFSTIEQENRGKPCLDVENRKQYLQKNVEMLKELVGAPRSDGAPEKIRGPGGGRGCPLFDGLVHQSARLEKNRRSLRPRGRLGRVDRAVLDFVVGRRFTILVVVQQIQEARITW